MSETSNRQRLAPDGDGASPCPPRVRGRPRQLDRCERETRILDAMERVLAHKGLHAASMSAIAREAAMSKRTLYQVFNSRARLFEACVRRIRTTFVRPLRDDERDLPIETRLIRLLTPGAAGAGRALQTAILRAIVAEAARHPEIARTFRREGPEEARRLIREELGRAAERGEVRLDDVEAAARLLCDMAFENPVDRLIDPRAAAPTPAQAMARAELAVRVFLRGVGA